MGFEKDIQGKLGDTIDELNNLFDSSVDEIPDTVDPEWKAGVNNISQTMKKMANDGVSGASQIRQRGDEMLNEFKMKHGIKSN